MARNVVNTVNLTENVAAIFRLYQRREDLRLKLIRALLLVFVAACGGFAAEDTLPDLAPQVRSVYPGGGQRGQILEITIKGRFLNDTQQIRFSRPDLVAELSSSDFYQV